MHHCLVINHEKLLEEQLPHADYYELRIDLFSRLDFHRIARWTQSYPSILTWRQCQDKISLEKLQNMPFHFIDVAVEEYEKLRPRLPLILSYHNFSLTPDLSEILATMKIYSPDVYKIVTTAISIEDSHKMIAWLEKQKDPIIGMTMGQWSYPTRSATTNPTSWAIYDFLDETAKKSCQSSPQALLG